MAGQEGEGEEREGQRDAPSRGQDEGEIVHTKPPSDSSAGRKNS